MSGIMALAWTRPSGSGSSSGSPPPGTATAGPAWAWPSSAPSRSCTADTRSCARPAPAAQSSLSPSPAPDDSHRRCGDTIRISPPRFRLVFLESGSLTLVPDGIYTARGGGIPSRTGALMTKCARFVSAIAFAALCGTSFSAAARDDDASSVLVNARRKFFGVENVDGKGRIDNDKVIVSWASNTTYLVAAAGHVFLLDSYINRPELPTPGLDKRRTPILPQDFIDARVEAIFLGHGHGDHADNAAYVAKWASIPIYASPETCDVMQQDVTRMWNDPNPQNGGVKMIPNGDPVNCIGVVPRNSPPGEYTGTLDNPT